MYDYSLGRVLRCSVNGQLSPRSGDAKWPWKLSESEGEESVKTDEHLLKFYLDLHSSEAYEWNMSPDCLYVEYITRQYVRTSIGVFDGMKVCNIGIGVGEWDDYLGYMLNGKGNLTSVDIDSDICDMFRYRQLRERHPNPSNVICMDILDPVLPANEFDLVTVIGSTVKQTGQYQRTLQSCFDLLNPGGVLIYMDFVKNHMGDEFVQFVHDTPHQVLDISKYDVLPQLEFFIGQARKQ